MPATPRATLTMTPGRTRLALWGGFYLLVLAAWVLLFAMARTGPVAGPPGLWASLCLPADAAPIGVLVAMWAVMGAAMMLPTFVPTLRTFRDLGHAGAANGGTAAALVAGYLAVWLGAAVLGAGAQWGLARAGLLAPGGQSLSPALSAVLLIMAGLYQFSRAKAACLSHCRRPLTYFMQHWRPGMLPALRMGLGLGVACLGCCWALMALAFVGGTMNLIWMGAATLFMTLEKLPEIGRILTRPAGYALLAAGCIMALRAII